jgi:hypothetical protein
MDRELDSTEIAIQENVQQLLAALQALAHLSNELNIHNLVLELEVLSLQLQGDSKLIDSTQGITGLYETVVANVDLLHTKLKTINLTQQVDI